MFCNFLCVVSFFGCCSCCCLLLILHEMWMHVWCNILFHLFICALLQNVFECVGEKECVYVWVCMCILVLISRLIGFGLISALYAMCCSAICCCCCLGNTTTTHLLFNFEIFVRRIFVAIDLHISYVPFFWCDWRCNCL